MGLNVNDCMQAAVSLTGEWSYKPVSDGKARNAAIDVASRLERIGTAGRTIPVKHRTLEETLNPQPEMAAVMGRFLEWVDGENDNLHAGLEPPAFETPDGEPIFPADPDDLWWLTGVQQRQTLEERKRQPDRVVNDDDAPASDPDAPSDQQNDGEVSEASFSDSDTSGSASRSGSASDFGKECAPCEATFFADSVGRRSSRAAGAPLSFWNELSDERVPAHLPEECSISQQIPEPQAAAASQAPPSVDATAPADAAYVVHLDSVHALPGELRRRAKAGHNIDVKQ